MAISEFEIFKVDKAAKKFCADRNMNFPPDQLYIDYKLEDQALYLFEVRPRWDDPTEKLELMVAKILYVKKDKVWKLYWQRQNMKWQLYEDEGVNSQLEPLLKIVWEDAHACFWG